MPRGMWQQPTCLQCQDLLRVHWPPHWAAVWQQDAAHSGPFSHFGSRCRPSIEPRPASCWQSYLPHLAIPELHVLLSEQGFWHQGHPQFHCLWVHRESSLTSREYGPCWSAALAPNAEKKWSSGCKLALGRGYEAPAHSAARKTAVLGLLWPVLIQQQALWVIQRRLQPMDF